MTAAVEPPLEEVARALDEATGQLRALDAEARAVATRAQESLNSLHRAALTTVVRRLKDDPRGKELLFELVDDPGVRMVLMMHGIVRPDPETQARQVLERVRPGLQSHGGDVELVGLRDTVALVRLQGACTGCSMASVTMRAGVEAALLEGVPGVTSVEVLPDEPAPTLIPLSAIGLPTGSSTGRGTDGPVDGRSGLSAAGWCRAEAAESLSVGELVACSLAPAREDPVQVIVVNTAGQLAAYLNACAHQGLPLDDALVDSTTGTLTCPWHGFCYDSATGECLTMPGAQLEQLPLRVEAGQVWIRVGGRR